MDTTELDFITMNRKEVLDKFIASIIENYSEDDREEEITQLLMENWSKVDGWNNLSKEIQEEFNNEKLKGNYIDKKYDDILRFKLRDDFKGITNEYLSDNTGIKITTGIPVDLESCPCCGYKNLEKRSDFEICKVCWWEDDGQDNDYADELGIGVNYEIDLTTGRFNYLKFGIYDPKRTDLKELCENPKKFKQGRAFKLIDENQIIELDTDWTGEVKNNKD